MASLSEGRRRRDPPAPFFGARLIANDVTQGPSGARAMNADAHLIEIGYRRLPSYTLAQRRRSHDDFRPLGAHRDDRACDGATYDREHLDVAPTWRPVGRRCTRRAKRGPRHRWPIRQG